MKRLFHTLIAIVLCSSCSLTKQTKEKEIENIVVEEDYDYSDVSDYDLTWETIFDVDVEKYYVYFYSLTCSHCLQLKNFIIKSALERKDIYFVKSSNKDHLTNDSKKLIGAENPENFYILGYPTLVQIKDLKCIKNLAGISQIKEELK